MHVYCSGIGGVGIGPLAMLALDAGFLVSGSDLHQSEMTDLLGSRGANVSIGQDGSQIATAHQSSPIEWFVYSAALPEDHPELVFAKQNNIKLSKRDEFINTLLSEKNLKLIAVSGTHGKTTVTGMITWLFKQLNLPVSYAIGTTISFGPPAQYDPKSEYFVYECDEFDRNFLKFSPTISALPSVDYDHSDTYPTQDEYNGAFSDFIAQSGHAILWSDTAEKLYVDSNASTEILSRNDPGISSLTLTGEHNRANAWLAVQTIVQLFPEIEHATIVAAINNFPGTNRRFEKLEDNLITDYAHHPTEIAATLQAAKELSKHVVVVYQPHQNIRQHEIIAEGGYKDTFANADHVYWLPTYLSRENEALDIITPQQLITTTTTPDKCEAAEMNDSLWQSIKAHMSEGSLVIAMAAGDLDPWLRELLS
ncbi:hypothetical protein KC973_00490 [Candidatus Saccharibacteria bacterium]|nr:hypothetical protein [Candidatus Saccharibacteria bacterium]